MTRGRKKDLTIPPTRALTQQRDYRARKAHYLSELEDRCRHLEDENSALQQELRALKAGLPVATPVDPQLMSASSELMRDLSAASSALQRFQNLAYPNQPDTRSHNSPSLSTASSTSSFASSRLRPAFFPSPSLSDVSLPSMDVEQDKCPWQEEGTSRPPPESQSLRKILCIPNSSDVAQSDVSRPSSSMGNIHRRRSHSPTSHMS